MSFQTGKSKLYQKLFESFKKFYTSTKVQNVQKLINEVWRNYKLQAKSDKELDIIVSKRIEELQAATKNKFNILHFFSKRLMDKQFLKEIKAINPMLLDVDDIALLQIVKQMLQEPSPKDKVIIKISNEIMSITLERIISLGLPLRLTLDLSKGTQECFFSHVTAPLVEAVHDLKSCQKELCDLLIQKDKEINEYREEGARLYYEHIKRLNARLRAPAFNYDTFKAQHNLVTKMFKDDDTLRLVYSTVKDNVQNRNEEITRVPVKRENTDTVSNDHSSLTVEEENVLAHSSNIIIKKEAKQLEHATRETLNIEHTDPVINDTSPVLIKEENVKMGPSSGSDIKSKPKRSLNL